MTKFPTEQTNFQICFHGGQLKSLQILEQEGGGGASDFYYIIVHLL